MSKTLVLLLVIGILMGTLVVVGNISDISCQEEMDLFGDLEGFEGVYENPSPCGGGGTGGGGGTPG
jgi:hypothetical protein